MQEIWKDIFSYDGLYQISNFGNVKSFHRHKDGKTLNPVIATDGYRRIGLRKQNKSKYAAIHRLVASAFIPNPINLPEVNHIDGDKLNNNLLNLEWCDRYRNIQHAHSIGLINIPKGKDNCMSKQVIQFDLCGNFIKEWGSIGLAARELKISSGDISSCCTGRLQTANGYIWRHKEDAIEIDLKSIHRGSSKQVNQLNSDGDIIHQYKSVVEATRKNEFPGSAEALIGACCRGKRKAAYGYIWEYIK